jgi:hypothetical protein
MTATQQRDRAMQLAKVDPTAGLAAARGIEDPWFRAQALAWVAHFGPDQDYDNVLAEARAASQSAQDPYAAVGSAAWWIRSMVDRDRPERVLAEVRTILAAAERITNPVSRLEALFLLFQAVFGVNAARASVLEPLISACKAADSWKGHRCLRDLAIMLASCGHAREAAEVLASMQDGAHKRQADRSISARERREPRPFFW